MNSPIHPFIHLPCNRSRCLPPFGTRNVSRCKARVIPGTLLSQVVAVVLATAGAVLSISNFENAFDNTHQRVGLALYAFIWLQPLVGFLRPDRGARARGAWYLAHWLLGVGVCVVGVANVYVGLHTYQERTGRSARPWTLLLTVEVAALAFVYLVQDRWSYVLRQREEAAASAALGDGRSQGSTMYPANDHKEVVVVP